MTTTQHDDLAPRLFPHTAGPLGQDGPAWPVPARPDGDDDDAPECVDCARGIPLAATNLQPGDRITEVGTPEGPYYPVLEIDRTAGVLVLDGGEPGAPDPLPVPLAVAMDGLVLKHPGSPAR